MKDMGVSVGVWLLIFELNILNQRKLKLKKKLNGFDFTLLRCKKNSAPYYQVSEVDLVFQSSCQEIQLNSGGNLSMELGGLKTSGVVLVNFLI